MRKQLLVTGVLAGAIFLATCDQKKETEPKSNVRIAKHARPLKDTHYVSTPARLARGSYLAYGILRCFSCHSPRDTSQPGHPWIESQKGSGSVYFRMDSIYMVAPNITPDKETGAGLWTDDMFARAIREGVGHDGRGLDFMPFWNFASLSDEDLASVIVYIRSIPPVKNKLPARHMSEEFEKETQAQPHDPVTSVPAPDLSTALNRGRYLVEIGECEGCHTGWYARNPGFFGGGNVIHYSKTDSVCSPNLTPDITGVGGWTDPVFASVMRTGKTGHLKWIMPWSAFRNINDSDLSDILTALKTLPAVNHLVKNDLPPTDCEVCGRRHGYGMYNKIEPLKAVPVDTRLYTRYAGRFLNKYGDTTKIRLDGKKLWVSTHQGETELVPVTDSTFRASGFPATVMFVRDKKGSVDSLYFLDITRIVSKRVL